MRIVALLVLGFMLHPVHGSDELNFHMAGGQGRISLHKHFGRGDSCQNDAVSFIRDAFLVEELLMEVGSYDIKISEHEKAWLEIELLDVDTGRDQLELHKSLWSINCTSLNCLVQEIASVLEVKVPEPINSFFTLQLTAVTPERASNAENIVTERFEEYAERLGIDDSNELLQYVSPITGYTEELRFFPNVMTRFVHEERSLVSISYGIYQNEASHQGPGEGLGFLSSDSLPFEPIIKKYPFPGQSCFFSCECDFLQD